MHSGFFLLRCFFPPGFREVIVFVCSVYYVDNSLCRGFFLSTCVLVRQDRLSDLVNAAGCISVPVNYASVLQNRVCSRSVGAGVVFSLMSMMTAVKVIPDIMLFPIRKQTFQ